MPARGHGVPDAGATATRALLPRDGPTAPRLCVTAAASGPLPAVPNRSPGVLRHVSGRAEGRGEAKPVPRHGLRAPWPAGHVPKLAGSVVCMQRNAPSTTRVRVCTCDNVCHLPGSVPDRRVPRNNNGNRRTTRPMVPHTRPAWSTARHNYVLCVATDGCLKQQERQADTRPRTQTALSDKPGC